MKRHTSEGPRNNMQRCFYPRFYLHFNLPAHRLMMAALLGVLFAAGAQCAAMAQTPGTHDAAEARDAIGDAAASTPVVPRRARGDTANNPHAVAPADTANNPHAAPTADTSNNPHAEATADTAIPVPPETTSVTRHAIHVGGHKIDYTATAGNLLLRNTVGQPEASVFYVAYTADTKSAATRPVTFLFNGGPGAGTVFLMMGSIGPKRALTSSPAITGPAPYVVTDNPESLIDKTDLVFIDAVGTGYSKIVGHGTAKRFWGVDEDLNAFERFIERYLTDNQRWNSPKYLLGESYGTARAAMLAYRLSEDSIALNGVILLSSVLNSAGQAPGYDLQYEHYLPTYAAIAWYHDKIVPKPPSLPALLDEVRAYAMGPYAHALAAGDALPDAERDAVAARVAHYTGLDESYVKQSRLRIWPSRFRKQLLRDESRNVGRYDARFEGIDYDDIADHTDYDPSVTSVASTFDAALHQYLAQDLHFTTPERYRVFNDEALRQWNWKHREWWGEELAEPYAGGDLAEAMRQNPQLRVLSLNGYFDLATPFFSTEYDLSHMGLDPSLRANVQLKYYQTGHMVYLDDGALGVLKADLARFFDTGAH